jgi:hypothetical protein
MGKYLGDKDQMMAAFEDGAVSKRLDKEGIKHEIGKDLYAELRKTNRKFGLVEDKM